MDIHETEKRLLNGPAGKQWKRIGVKNHHGINIPLFSLHTTKSCGIGEYPDLIPLIKWCKSVGFDVIQLLPLNDTGPDTSPYNAVSAFALNPIHIGLASLEGVTQDTELLSHLHDIQKLTSSQRIDYAKVKEDKEAFLRRYYRLIYPQVGSSNSYREFLKEHSWLAGYALFKALKIQHNWQSWHEWPEECRYPTPEGMQALLITHREEIQYHQFLQYLCFQQFKDVKVAALASGILLKGDIPITISPEAADVWLEPHLFLKGLGAGAPPDQYSKEGQSWGFPLYDWKEMVRLDYHWWRQRLEVASELYDLYRIDHIVGFFRIWGIPEGKKAKEGAFVPADTSTWIHQGRTILEMMLRHSDMLPIGEDLGTVPDEVRACLLDLGICGTKVMRWERRWKGDGSFIPVKDYPHESLTTVSTHDSEPLALWWQNQREEAELYARSRGWGYTPKLLPEYRREILRDSHQSSSLFHINLLLEYLALFPELVWPTLEDERINIPGTISQNNWTYRLHPAIEQLTQNSKLTDAFKGILGTRENAIR